MNQMYCNNCIYFPFSVETIWKNFWSIEKWNNIKLEEPSEDLLIGHNKENQGLSSEESTVKKQTKQQPFRKSNISSEQMTELLGIKQVQTFINKADYALYQYLIDILLPKVLKPIPNR